MLSVCWTGVDLKRSNFLIALNRNKPDYAATAGAVDVAASRSLRRCAIALEGFVAFARAADADVLAFQLRLDDAENRFREQVSVLAPKFSSNPV